MIWLAIAFILYLGDHTYTNGFAVGVCATFAFVKFVDWETAKRHPHRQRNFNDNSTNDRRPQ